MTTKLVSNILDSNTFIFDNDKTVLIFDAGAELSALKSCLKKTPDAIFITHGHYDHIQNLDDYAEAFSCPIFIKNEVLEKLTSPQLNCSEDLVIKAKPNIFTIIKNEEPIKINELNVMPIFTPGHSSCSVSYLVGDELFAGDFLFKTSVGRYDLITSNKQELINSINKIKNYSFKIVHSGHGEDSTREEQEKNLAVWTRFLLRK